MNKAQEVYPRMYMSGYEPTADWDALKKCGITHIVTVTPYADR